MKSTNFACTTVAAILFAGAAATPALADGSDDTYISGTGSDMNNCSLSSPCQSMTRAVNTTASGGVIHCLDSFDNGEALIAQSITIDCSNSTAGGGPFTINGPGATVVIRGLFMSNLGAAGIIFQNGAALYVENCRIYQNNNGILFEPSAAASLFVVNSTIRNNAAGVLIKPASGGSVTATFDGVTITGNSGGGVKTDTTNGAINLAISNSTIAKNAGNGLNAVGGAGGQNVLELVHDVIASNGTAGVQANGNSAAVLVNNTSILNNLTGATSVVAGGRILSYGNNSIVGSAGSGFTGSAALQ
jgi:hypothetical protein